MLEEYVNNFILNYTKKTKLSKQRARLSRLKLADSRSCANFRFSMKELIYPIVGVSASGANFIDIDNNDYIDMSMGFGTLLFGHYPHFIKEAIEKNFNKGIQLGPQSDAVYRVADLLCELTGVDRFAFCNTGTEAIMMAIRLARVYTKKNKIIIFSNSYHGNYDATLVFKSIETNETVPFCSGLPSNFNQDIYICEYNNTLDLETLVDSTTDIAAILVEPVRSREPNKYSKQFLTKIREISTKIGAVLIFDEVVTGFRCHPGGGKAYFNIEPDMVVYGKIIGGGLPVGVVGGSLDIMSGVDGGLWDYDDKSYPAKPSTFFAGTFNKNPLVMDIMFVVLSHIKEQGNILLNELNKKSKYIADDLNAFFDKNNIPISLKQFSSLMKFDFRQNLDLFIYQLVYNGIYIWEGKTMFLSTAHTDKDIQKFIKITKDVCCDLSSYGYFK